MFKHSRRLFFYSFFALLIFVFSCKQQPKIANKFYTHYQNKVYYDFDTTAYYAEFQKQLSELKPGLHYSAPITDYYTSHKFEPYFIDKFLFDGELQTLIKYLKGIKADGLNDSLFHYGKIEQDLDTLNANHFTKITDVYPVIARLEIETSNALIGYSGIMQYGAVDPHKLYRRYDIPVKRPDSSLVEKAFQVENLNSFLEQLQPKSDAYMALKKELATINTDAVDSAKLQRLLIIKLNMERLRWQIPVKDARYLWVNIPAFKLQWVEDRKVVFDMKVCVGQPKPAGYDTLMARYLKTHNIDDKPFNHETPMLTSRINTIQLNPTWNIPASIAQSEIYFAIQKNPDYLTNNNIRVYYKDRLIDDPDTIRWSRINRQKMPYSFKQDASELNALGKFKFIFDNSSSIYLHDTPNKKAFKSSWRAVSHGCVRVDDPLKLTEALVNDTNAVDNIRMEVGLTPTNPKDSLRYKAIQAKRSAAGFELKSKYIGLKPDMQLFIDYYTCWPDPTGKIEFYNDVYKMDAPLEKAMGKYMSKL